MPVKKGTSTLKEPLTEEEERKLLQVCSEADKRLVLLLIDSGMHISVLSSRDRFKNLRYSDGYLTWYRPKKEPSKGLVRVKATRRVQSFIEQFIREHKPKTSQYYHLLFKSLGECAGIKGLSSLSFRHTFAVRTLQKGGNVSVLQELMGVKSADVLMRYLKYKNPMVEDFYKRVDW